MRLSIRAACLGLILVHGITAQTQKSDVSKPPSSTAQSKPTASKPSKDVEDLLREWSESLRDVRTLHVTFSQTKHLRVLRRPRKSSGEVLLVGKQLLMRIRNTKGTVETELGVEDGEVRIHYPRLKKVEIYPRDDSTKRKPPFPMMIEDVEDLPREYVLRVERENAARILVMKPRDKKSKFVEVRARFEDGRIQGLEQKNRRGDRVVMAIDTFEVNPKIEAKDVALVVPQGTKSVHIGGTKDAPAKRRKTSK